MKQKADDPRCCAPEMKIAVIADIHGNLDALEAVLSDIEGHSVDVTVNLGDLASGPLQPRETVNRLMALNFPTIRGNHERQLLTLDLEQMGPSDRFATSCLLPHQREWFASLPSSLRLCKEVHLCHGTPQSDMTYFLETVEETGCRHASNSEIEQRAGSCYASLILCGHTHLARVVRLEDGRIILNPGSVGLQAYEGDRPYPHKMEAGSPYARYAIAELKKNEWSFDLVNVAYDWEAAAELAGINGRPDWQMALQTGHL